ncbi:hypothetical protein PSYCIT7_010170 [Pseudomonas syringae Cit 7]|uniref:Uncharacterized protein n=1 Tax=Pseudomonas syringae Cit 7 TaxID=629264 RepID=A0A8T8M2M4_PSESX|nr:hypothetical protein [Pseudomonas syringae]PBP60209.1 hypothetical protein CCL19_22705 [Pseudomonas syringae]QUP67964.1 hypothetical protein PSYCIT7_010170 [Pseudomonas syringae Cit 7]SDS28705.1 hypothetical protein SAMN05421724_1086 [Pseudomonas syringae]
MSKLQKIVLFLGNADTEGVTAKLTAVGTVYKRKMLESRISNWETIIEIFHEYDVICVVAKLTTSTFNVISSASGDVKEQLFALISSKPHLFLAHESLLSGQQQQSFSDYANSKYEGNDGDLLENFYGDVFQPPSPEIRNLVLIWLEQFGISVVPYVKNVELVVLASSFVEKNERNLIFRIYVPSERMWANEAEKLLQLFREYLQKVSGLDVRHEQYRTNQGVVYEIFGGDSVQASSLPQKFEEFSSFMEACVANPSQAQLMLGSKNLNSKEVINIVERYSKEARRLHVDIKQERERRLLSIRHTLESELAEFVRDEDDWNIIYKLADQSVPIARGVTTAVSFDRLSFVDAPEGLTVNINPQIIGTVNGVVARHIQGDQHIGADAEQLLQLIEAYGGANKVELSSALHELNDTSARPEDRMGAKQKLKSFVYTVAGKAGDIACGVLQSYIESQAGL